MACCLEVTTSNFVAKVGGEDFAPFDAVAKCDSSMRN
jgi:hypothetical protein